MRKKRSLVQVYLVSLIALAAIPVAINGAIWIATEYDSFTEQSENLRKTFIESRSTLLEREVDKAVDYIDYNRSQLKRRLHQELRQEVAVALALIANLHKEFAATESRREILLRARKSIEPLRFHDQKGFFFALRGKGDALLPPLQASSRERLKQDSLLEAFAEQVREATRESTHGILEFQFGDERQRNISYVYYYKPLDIYIGASVYLRDEIDRIKQEVIERLAAVPFDSDSSVLFVTDRNGKQLVNPYNPEMVGKRQPGMESAVEVLTQQDGGELVEMEWVRPGGQTRSPAVSYVELDKEWGWVIGAGFLLDKYYALMDAQRSELESRVLRHTLFISSVALALMLFATLVARRLASLSAKGFHRFQEFFAQASERSTQIDVRELPFAEFEELARHANYMVETRSQTERALKLSERRFQLALDASQSHLWDLDMQSDTIVVGEGFYRRLGYPPPTEDTPMSRFGSIFHPDDFASLRRVLRSSETLERGLSVEFRVRDNAGVYRWILSRGDIVDTAADGSPLRAMGIMSDVTERKRMEEELIAARIAAEDANHAKSQFLSSASHELRTPLNGVLGYVQLLQRQKNLPKDSQGYLDAIENCGQHLLNLINDVLDLAKVESGTFKVSVHTTKLRDVLDSVGDILRQRAQAKNLGYEHKVASGVPELVRTDEVKLRQILVNLLGNSVKFTETGKVGLEVDYDPTQQSLLFSVVDTGIGIPDEKIKSIFEPFSRVNEHDGKGTGLGLAICRRLCEAMGGKLSVVSEMGKGTTFRFDIPVSDEDVIKHDRRRQRDEPPVAPARRASGLSVIIADDNEDNRKVLEGMLDDTAAQVRHAANGEEVLTLLQDAPADVVLMDYRMPQMDGVECTRQIRSEPSFHETVVIMVTASAGLDTRSQAFEAGCAAFLSKPVQIDELLDTIGRFAGVDVQETVPTSNGAPEQSALTVSYDGAPLPASDRQALLDLLALGDIAAMNEFCETRENGEHSGFIEQAQALLQNFDFQALKKLLQEAKDS